MHQNTSTKSYIFSSESKEENIVSTTASKLDREPSKQADPW
jgi:hypothetical protein